MGQKTSTVHLSKMNIPSMDACVKSTKPLKARFGEWVLLGFALKWLESIIRGNCFKNIMICKFLLVGENSKNVTIAVIYSALIHIFI